MAEHDNTQLYYNYQSYHKVNGDRSVENSKNRIVWNIKRKKIVHYDESTKKTKCQRPNNSFTKLLTASTLSSDRNLKQTLITDDRPENIVNVIMKKCGDNNESFKCEKIIQRIRPIIRNCLSCYTHYKSNALAITLVAICLLFQINLCCGFVLDGTQNSYAQFRKWYTGLNGTLELEFKTEQPNGLVLYTDDGGTYDFFELKLVEGALRLRYNLGGGAQIITVGRDLHDGHWHKVQVS